MIEKIVIIGGPRSGKSTYASELEKQTGFPLYSTDSTVYQAWSHQSDDIAGWFDRNAPFIIEGASAIRGLRKWLMSHSTGKPIDELVYCRSPLEKLTGPQLAMGRSVHTMYLQILPELRRRNVKIRLK